MSGGNWKVLPSNAEKDAHILAMDKLYGLADASGNPTPQPPTQFIGFTAPGKVETEVPPGYSLTVPGPGWSVHAVNVIPHPVAPNLWAINIPDDLEERLAQNGGLLTAQENAKINAAIAGKGPLDPEWTPGSATIEEEAGEVK
jgi:hypothetical protein